MVEKIGTIKNPLTIIAIFAAIAEISGTLVLPFIAAANQSIYIWFLMGFPLLLVLLFFITLNFNHKVLYAPSDFKDEDNFFKSLRPATPSERENKLAHEVLEIEKVSAISDELPTDERKVPYFLNKRDIRTRYSNAEELALNKIAKEFKQPLYRSMNFISSDKKKMVYVFDGVMISEDLVTAIEVKYYPDEGFIPNRFNEMLTGIINAAETVTQGPRRDRFSLIFVAVTDAPKSVHEKLAKRLNALLGIAPFPVDVRVFSLEDLTEEQAKLK